MPNYWYDHVHLVSPEPEKTAQFYERMFNAKKVDVREFSDGRITVTLDLNGSIVLVKNRTAQPEPSPASPETGGYGLEHFGIRTDDIEAAVANLKANGVQFKEELRAGSSPGLKLAFLWAPENVLIELVERKSP